MFWFLLGLVLVILGGYIVITLLQVVFYIIGWGCNSSSASSESGETECRRRLKMLEIRIKIQQYGLSTESKS